MTMLERAVGLDPSYAPAWEKPGVRYYFDGQYADGGEAALQRSEAARQRALSLDPGLVAAARGLIVLQTERGELPAAYQHAAELLRRRPDHRDAHFVMSYVLRYAGLAEESARQCEAALALDPTDFVLRSCSAAFDHLGRYDRAMDFLRLDAGSEWSESAVANLLLHQGRRQEALERLRRLTPARAQDRGLRQACLEGQPASAVDRLAKQTEQEAEAVRDSEVKYLTASYLAFCGRNEAALRMLRRAIEGNYCAVPGLDSSPWWVHLRGTPEFAAIRAAAVACREKFLAARSQSPAR